MIRCSLIAALLFAPLDPPGLCIGAPSIPGADAELVMYDHPSPAGWRVWASEPARIARMEGGAVVSATVSLTRSVELPAGTTYVNAFPVESGARFWLYLCAPGDLPPGGGYRLVFPGVWRGNL